MLVPEGVVEAGTSDPAFIAKVASKPTFKLTVSPESGNGRYLKSMHRISFSRTDSPGKEYRKSSTNTCSESKGSSTRFGTQEFGAGVPSLHAWNRARVSIESPLRKQVGGFQEVLQVPEIGSPDSYRFPRPVSAIEDRDQMNLRNHSDSPAHDVQKVGPLAADLGLSPSKTGKVMGFSWGISEKALPSPKISLNSRQCERGLHQIPYCSLTIQSHPRRRGKVPLYKDAFKKFKSHPSPQVPHLPGDLAPVGTPPKESAVDRELFVEQLSESPKTLRDKQTDRTITEGGFRQKSMFWIEASSVREATINDKCSILGGKESQKYHLRARNPKSSRDVLEMDLQLQRVISGKSTVKASNIQHSLRMDKSLVPYEASNISMGRPPTFMVSGKYLPLYKKDKKQPQSQAPEEDGGLESQVSSLEQPKLRGTISGASLPPVPRDSSGRVRIDTNPDLGELLKTFGLNPPIF